MLRHVLLVFAMGFMALGADVVSSQTASTGSGQAYPNRPIRIVVSGPGNSLDFAARLIAQGLTISLGQQVIVENRGSGVIPGEVVSKAAPDGYTLLVAGGTLWIGPLLQKTPYDPVRDFSPVSLTNSVPNLLAVHPSLPVRSVKELIALAKARPGELNYSSAGTGSASHLAGELFKHMAGVNIVRIPYKSGSVQMADLLGGLVQLTFGLSDAVMPHVRTGMLRGIAVTSPQPTALAPGFPTIAASGLPGYEAASMSGVFVPAKTPEEIINRLNQEIVRFLNMAATKELFAKAGVETVGSSPAQFAATIKSESVRMGRLIRDAGIHAD